MDLDRKALVVDDDAAIRLMLKRILTRHNFEVDTALDGAEAIEKILANDYAVIVLDVMMPRIDGRAVIRYIKERAPQMLSKIIVVTAFGPNAISEVCPPVGRHLEKPFDLNHLLREVTECYWTGASY